MNKQRLNESTIDVSSSQTGVTTRQQNKIYLYPNRPSNDKYAKSFVYHGIIEWNRLPLEIQAKEDRDAFKKAVKKSLLAQEALELRHP